MAIGGFVLSVGVLSGGSSAGVSDELLVDLIASVSCLSL